MRNLALTLLAVAMVFLSACDGTPDYSSKEAFVRDFISTMDGNERGKFANYFLKAEDFQDTEEAKKLKEVATGSTRSKFIENCQRLALEMEGKSVTIEGIVFTSTEPVVSPLLKNVEEHHSNVLVNLTIDDQSWQIRISEIIKTAGKWRMAAFFTTIDLGTEKLDPVELQSPPDPQEVTEESDQQN